LVRKLDYTWEEVLNEKVPRILFTVDKLVEEQEKREEEIPDDPGSQNQSNTMQKAN